MKLLLDTHVLIWALTDDKNLPERIADMINDRDNIVYFSAASLWELAIKNYKAPEKCPYDEAVVEEISIRSGFHCLNINSDHIKSIRTLRTKQGCELANYDPFDRMLISQAKTEGAFLLSHDKNFQYYEEPCIERF
ncbi:MAG: type II toxin-antitoxin system VapC family toxin [Lachnospiraceae bacterium]|nr:type II toxin-antitoxin system VapC family toxin [Lachnospiraceae bacterium]